MKLNGKVKFKVIKKESIKKDNETKKIDVKKTNST